jgi:hypothetical protein
MTHKFLYLYFLKAFYFWCSVKVFKELTFGNLPEPSLASVAFSKLVQS